MLQIAIHVYSIFRRLSDAISDGHAFTCSHYLGGELALLSRRSAAALLVAVALSGDASAGKFKNQTDSMPPTGPSKLTGKQHTVHDIYCGPGQVPCDDIFIRYCALIGGKMSERQGWGGQTCFHRSEW